MALIMTNPSSAPTLIAPSPAAHTADGQARTYEVRTFGCQMNVHDSERLSGSLESAGYVRAELGEEADVVVINTCAVRDNAAGKLYGTLGHLKSRKDKHDGMQIAVGGCLAQMDKDAVLDKAPWVDVVFGTHNMGSLPSLLERARHNGEAELEILESLEIFPSTLPTKRDSVYSGWVSISVGCNNTCTFCIVPSLRGKEKDRRPGDILNEIRLLVDDGAIEVTLLGQNVNSYGVEFGDRQAFGKLLRAAGEIDGLERIRFTSPHPAAFTDDVIDAMAETPSVMPQLHMPLQSGSDRILKAMRRSYRSERFLGILDRVRERMPHAAITTDIIVGFPGETDEDFEDTMRVVEQARFSSAFTFQYSIREGTPAATMPDQVPKAVVQERYERLIALQERISHEENQKQVGRELQVLVSMGEGKKDAATHRLTGRAEDNRLVHFEVPAGSDAAATGRCRHCGRDARRAVPPAGRRTGRCAAADPAHPCRRRVGSHAGGVLRHPRTRGRIRGPEGRVARPSHAARRGVSGPAPAAPRLWAVVGATGTGKTALSLDLAEALAARGTAAEIVNADAMQLYRGMDIGTAKLPVGERRGIPHHLLDVLDVTDEAAVAWYQEAARAAIADIHDRGRDAILVGGSGLYVSSVLFDFRFPPHDDVLRAELEAELDCTRTGRAVRTAARAGSRRRRRASTRRTAGGSSAHSRCSRRAPRRTVRHCRMSPSCGAKHTRIIGVAVPARSARRSARCPSRAHVGGRDFSTRSTRFGSAGLEAA